jgi:hypothetical protein
MLLLVAITLFTGNNLRTLKRLNGTTCLSVFSVSDTKYVFNRVGATYYLIDEFCFFICTLLVGIILFTLLRY